MLSVIVGAVYSDGASDGVAVQLLEGVISENKQTNTNTLNWLWARFNTILSLCQDNLH